MARTASAPISDMAILRRVVDSDQPNLSVEAAQAILKLSFASSDRARMNRLAAKNRDGKLKPAEEAELNSFIRVGQILGILWSKARRSLKANQGVEAGDE